MYVTEISKSVVFVHGNFFTFLLYAFQKQGQSILAVYFITKFLMNSNILETYFPIIFIKLLT